MKKKVMTPKKVMTTLHINREVRDRFKKLVGDQGRAMGDVVEELMKQRLVDQSSGARPDRVQMDQAVSLLTKAVCEQLRERPEWAMEALIEAGMGLPGASVFASRSAHFSDEKQELGKRLAHWMVQRSIALIKKGKRVVLVCDSGTTVFWFLKALGEAIQEYFKTSEGAPKLKEKDLVIVTNNMPGAESFVTYASLNTLEPSKKRISDLVDCRILAGTFLPEYVAITGTDTELDLENFAKLARSESMVKHHREPVFIAITTGNWITIQGAEGKALPCFLARGRGHGAFKSKLLEVSDEVFAMGPLGKMLLEIPVSSLNNLLKYSPDADSLEERSYEEIPTPASKNAVTKVVSTIRLKESILRDHSAYLCKKLGHYATLEDPSQKSANQASNEITQLDHLLFPFDKFCEEAFEKQLEIELPHKRTREESFRRQVFSVRDPQ